MTPSPHPLDDLAAYALGALDARERSDAEAHLAGCESCRQELASYQALALALTDERPPLGAPASAWTGIASQLRARTPADGPTPDSAAAPAPRALASLRAMLIGWGATAAVLALLSGIVLWREFRASDGEGDRVAALARAVDGKVIPLAGGMAGAWFSGRLYVNEEGTQGGLAVVGLPVLDAQAIYQVWFVRPDQTRASGGLFIADSRGAAVVRVSIPGPLSQFTGVGITKEPSGGSSGPTSVDLLSGPLYEN